jgi:isocitrate dehydrogenase
MLSIVPLMAGGGMYETGAGGSAPKHVQQLVEENHLRWDSLGEFLALAVSWKTWASRPATKGQAAGQDAGCRHRQAAGQQQGPEPKTGQLDNRGSQFYLAMYWAQALAAQTEEIRPGRHFAPLAKSWPTTSRPSWPSWPRCRASPVDIGGYYLVDSAKVEAVMRPSATFNAALKEGFAGVLGSRVCTRRVVDNKTQPVAAQAPKKPPGSPLPRRFCFGCALHNGV